MLEAIVHTIDTMSEWIGRIAGWLVLPLVCVILLEVLLRSVFHMQTGWAWDLGVQVMCVFIILGGSYALLYKGHVRVDIIVSRLSVKKQALVDVILFPFFFFGVSLLLWQVGQYAWNSVLMREHYTSAWFPVIYPTKLFIAVGVLALLLQGIANWLRDLKVVIQRRRGT